MSFPLHSTQTTQRCGQITSTQSAHISRSQCVKRTPAPDAYPYVQSTHDSERANHHGAGFARFATGEIVGVGREVKLKKG